MTGSETGSRMAKENNAKAFVASGSPLMRKIVAEVMREIIPDASRAESSFNKTARVRGTLFEVNQDRQNHEPLLQIAGIPVLQMKHFPSSGRIVSPVANSYRDNYSNFQSEMEDSDWSKTLEVTKILLSVIRVLVDNTIADYDVVFYAQVIQDDLEALKDEYGSRLSVTDDFELTLR